MFLSFCIALHGDGYLECCVNDVVLFFFSEGEGGGLMWEIYVDVEARGCTARRTCKMIDQTVYIVRGASSFFHSTHRVCFWESDDPIQTVPSYDLSFNARSARTTSTGSV